MAEFWDKDNKTDFFGLVVRFLERCTEDLGRQGCNDFDLPDTEFNRILVARANWEGGDPDEYKTLDEAIADLQIEDGKIYTYNWLVCGKLAQILKDQEF